MLNLLKPKFFIPIHGEFRHLYAHGKLAYESGIEKSNIFLLNNGDVLDVNNQTGQIVDSIPQNEIFVNGNSIWQDPGNIMNERINLSKNGIIILSATIGTNPPSIISNPKISSMGVVDFYQNNKITEMLKSNAQTYLEKYISNEIDLDTLNIELESSLVKLVYKQTFQKPKILVEINIKK